MSLQGEEPDLWSACISHTEWNVTMESYVVHTNYDEYAIFLTKKFSRHHGPTITAKLYGKGPNMEPVGAGAGSLLFLGERTLVRETQGVLALRKKSSASLVR